MGKFSQTFVAYHGCGNCHYDGTSKIISKGRKCIMWTYNLFWKIPIDVYNKVETRGQLKINTKANRKYQLRYEKWANLYSKGSFASSDFDSVSDSDSNYSNSGNESLANNASGTEQMLSDDEINGKLVINEIKETEQNLSLNPKLLAQKWINLYAKINSDSSLANNTIKNTSENLNETSETADNK